MKKNGNIPAFGIKKFGYISDFKSSVAQFNHLLQGTGQSVTSTEIDSIVDGVTPDNLNSFGCDNHHQKPVTDEFAAYRMVRTGRKTASGDEIVGLFVRNKKYKSYEGVTWTTRSGVKHEVDLFNKLRIV